jgi:hypothetical protein
MRLDSASLLTWVDDTTAVMTANPKVVIRFAVTRRQGLVDAILGLVLKTSHNLQS